MARRWFRVLTAAIALFLSLESQAVAVAQDRERFFSTAASQAIIIDGTTGSVLYQKNADERVAPASMSKLMTAAVVLDWIERGEATLDTEYTVSEKAWRTGGSKMFVLVDTQITVENLLKGLLAQSGNDAAIVLAENVMGTEEAFVTLMNQRARQWGLTGSTFTNATGRDDPGHRMTVRDIAMLSRQIWDRYPDTRYLFGIEEFTWSDISQRNRNPLLRTFAGADGMKTGYTEEAGFSLAGTAERNGERRFIVIAGLETERGRTREADRMMGLAFSEFERRTYFNPGDQVGIADVFGGRQEAVGLRIDVPVSYTLHREILDRAEATIVYKGPLPAPIRQGEQVAVLRVKMPGEEDREYPLYTMEAVPELSILSKLMLGARTLFTPPELLED